MNSILYFLTTFVFKIAASQTFTYSPPPSPKQSLTLRCVTDELGDTISFKLGNDNKGGCFAGGSCITLIPGYEQPMQRDGTITEMVITSCNKSRDAGSWTCAYGGLTSDPFEIVDCSGVATTEETSTTQHDVTTERLLTTANGSTATIRLLTTTNDSTTTIRLLTTTNDYTTTIQNTDIICTTPICIFIAALLSLIALFIIVSLIVLFVLCCTGRVTCILPHAFHKKNTSKTSNQNFNDQHENRQSYKTSSENLYQIYKGDGKTTSYQLKTDNQSRNESYSVDENGHQSKNKHAVTSDSSQSKEKHHPSIEYNIKNTKNPSTRDNRHVHNRGYY